MSGIKYIGGPWNGEVRTATRCPDGMLREVIPHPRSGAPLYVLRFDSAVSVRGNVVRGRFRYVNARYEYLASPERSATAPSGARAGGHTNA